MTAHALQSHAPGGPETLQWTEIDLPRPGPGEVRIKVRAAAANFPDTLIIRDLYQYKPQRPFAPGGEVSGLVDALGEDVDDLKIGDRVLGLPLYGGFATHVVVKRHMAAKLPKAMSFEEAAGLMFTYGTSHYALADRGNLKAGETLLVLGAAGGIGAAAVELGKAAGARVIAGVSSQDKADFARALGADETIIYPREMDFDAQVAFGRALKQAAPAGIDVIYDAVGGAYAEPALRAVAWDGRYLIIGFPAGIPALPFNLPLLKNCALVGVFWGAFTARNPKRHGEHVAELMALYRAGKIRPRISEILPMHDAPEALRRLENRQAKGKIVLTLD